ncbi:GPCR fungal pheromone mating factor [Mycena galopus ATCC 62051]|nr:GPCR fungal pheromone mating factor [Mycena galopus ATCC 62051]
MPPPMAVAAFLASVLILVPVPWHWRAGNTPTLSMFAWLWMSNLTYAINTTIWSGQVNNVAPVWCDIVTKLGIGATAGGPGCCLALVLQLWRVATCRHMKPRRALIMDLSLCWGYPAITMALPENTQDFIVQGHRFNIWADVGCLSTTYVSIPAILVFYAPLWIVLILNFVFSGLAFSSFWRQRHAFAAVLEREKSPFNMRRYVRAMLATLVTAIWDGAVVFVVLEVVFQDGILPYTSWADVHYDFGRVAQISMGSELVTPRLFSLVRIMWWTVPVSAYWVFCCFALSEEGVAEYAPWGRWVLRGFRSAPSDGPDAIELDLSSSGQTTMVDIDSVIDIKRDPEYAASFNSIDL